MKFHIPNSDGSLVTIKPKAKYQIHAASKVSPPPQTITEAAYFSVM
jgi:hypothetical protein